MSSIYYQDQITDILNITNYTDAIINISNTKQIKRIVGVLSSNVESLTIYWNNSLENVNIVCEEGSKLNWVTISRNSNLTSIQMNLPDSVTSIDYNDNKITKLPILPPNLVRLDCSRNPIKYLPALPKTIKNLCFGETKIDEFPELPFTPGNDIGFLSWWGTGIQPANTWGKDLTKAYKKWQESNALKEKERKIKQCKVLKEDLMIKTWETSRHIDWCLDIEEQAEWRYYQEKENQTNTSGNYV